MTQTINVVISDPRKILQLRTVPVLSPTVTPTPSLETLKDVEIQEDANGATTVYDSTRDKYEIRPLSFEDLSDASVLDGGEF